jgi:ATP synthase protein I
MRSPEQEHMWRLAGRYSALGIEMAVAVSLGALLGWWLDKRYGTQPWLLFFGLIVGVGAATRAVVHVVKTTKLSKL